MKKSKYMLCYGKDVISACDAVTPRKCGDITFMVGKKESGKSTIAQLEARESLKNTNDIVIFINPDNTMDYTYFTIKYSERVKVYNDSISESIAAILKDAIRNDEPVRWIYIDSADNLSENDQQRLYLLCQMAIKKNMIITILLSSMKQFATSGRYPYVMWSYIRNYIITELDDEDEESKEKCFYMDQYQKTYQYISNSRQWNTYENRGKYGVIVNRSTYVEEFEREKREMFAYV